ncbi:hypothetical protein BJ944DRAFT_271972 [Cunninghamella echinulata]|nr:hypothetical protein BJ944DRAFT_271972 [Cunninghamella echinulata]
MMSSKIHSSNSDYSFKSKWNQMVYKLNMDTSSSCSSLQHHQDSRRPSHCSDQSTCSTKTNDSIISITTIDKFIGMFKRRCSNTATTTTSTTANNNNHNHLQSSAIEEDDVQLIEQKESERMDRLYQIAMDEISYAEDSQGSRYYQGDVISAKEAMDDCAQAIVTLLHQVSDRQRHDHLHATLTPKLLSLQSRFDALPTVDP